MASSDARLRVLAIDDEPAFGDLFVRVLRRLADVTFVTSIAEAAPLVARGDIDVVVCDVNMPCGGAAAVERLVAAARPDMLTRIVYVTGGAFTAECAAFLARVGTRLVTKPFSPDDLRTAVARAVVVGQAG